MPARPLSDELLDHEPMLSVDRAIADLRRGEAVVVAESAGAGRGGGNPPAWLVLAVEALTPERLMGLAEAAGGALEVWLTRHRAAALGLLEDGDGVVAVTPADPADEAGGADGAGDSGIDPQASQGVDPLADAAMGVSILRRLTDPTDPAPLPAITGVAVRGEPGPRGAVLLAKLARLLPAVVAAPLPSLEEPARHWALRTNRMWVETGAIADYHTHAARTLRPVAEARVPLQDAEEASLVAFRPTNGGPEHLAIRIGAPDPEQPVLVRLHSECFTGDLLGSLRCDCGDQLRGAIAEIARHGGGLLLYLAQEGRGIGLVNKLRAYRLQDSGLDTFDANGHLGFDADERIYLPAAEMLRQLGFARVRLLTNNPDKLHQLARCGIAVVERVAHQFPTNGHNEGYLRAKAEKAGHLLY